jgi:tryptophan-rich sensory protein
MQFFVDYLVPLGVALFASNAGRFLGSLKVIEEGMDWYQSLRSSPRVNKAPTWMFTTAYDVINTLLGIATFVVYLEGGFIKHVLPFSFYLLQLMVLFYWPQMFFKFHQLGRSFYDLCGGLILASATSYFFSLSSFGATLLTLPLIIWLIYMIVLTWILWRANPRKVLVTGAQPPTIVRGDKEMVKQQKESGKEVREPAEIDERKPKVE